MASPDDQTDADTPRRKPSRGWYGLSVVLLVASVIVFCLALQQKLRFLNDQIGPMPRFVGPTPEGGTTINVASPGKQNIFYENLGSFEGKDYDTRRRQVWTTYAAPSMTCSVTHAQSGEAVEVRLPGLDEPESKSKTSKDQIITYNISGMQGHSLWVFDAPKPGEYRINVQYYDAVKAKPGDITIPPELTKAEKRGMSSFEGKAYEEARREAIEQAALAELEPIDVLFAVGPDPTRGTFFEVIGLKGAATVLAFGFTFSVLITLVTFMLRSGHVTPRGELSEVQRVLSHRA